MTNYCPMDLTTREQYAIRLIQELDKNELCVARLDLAARAQVPADYMVLVLRDLIHAGIVESLKGPGGGYALTRPARKITLAEVCEALSPGICPPEQGATKEVARIRDSVRRMLLVVLSRKKVADL